jgi:hypothetical protein
VSLREAIANAITRVVTAACAIEDGDAGYAYSILLDLELDLQRVVGDEEMAA